MATNIPDHQKQILVDLVRNAVQKLRSHRSGVRLFCGDEEVLVHLLDQAENWGSFLPIYLPDDLWTIVDDRKIRDQDRVFSVDGDTAPLLDNLWPVLGYHSHREVRGCFRSSFNKPPSNKLSILIGESSTQLTDQSFEESTRDLRTVRKQEAVDLTIPFRSMSSPATGLVRLVGAKVKTITGGVRRHERKRRNAVLRYVEDAFLKHCVPDATGDFSNAFPPNNLSEPEAHYESDFGQCKGPQLGTALDQLAMPNQVAGLKERLDKSRVLIVGGFGSGSDFLSWLALREMARAERNGGLFRIMQFAGTANTTAALSEMIDDDLHPRGSGIIFRDLLDPITAHWPIDSDKVHWSKGFVHTSGETIFHGYNFLGFLKRIRNEAIYQDTRIVITSQYDSLKQLLDALGRPYGDKWRLHEERERNVTAILESFKAEEFWNPAAEMEPSVMEDATFRIFRSWLNDSSNRIPRWLGRVHESEQNSEHRQISRGQIEQLIQHGNIANLYRLGAWARMWVRLLNSWSSREDFTFVESEVQRYASTVLEAYNELHSMALFGSTLRDR